MDAITGAIVSGLVVEAVVGASGPVSRRFLRGKVRVASALQPQIDRVSDRVAIAALSELRDTKVPDKYVEQLAEFLRSPQGRSLARRIAIAVLTGNTKAELRKELLDEILACLVLLHGIPEKEAAICAAVARRIIGEVSADLVKRLDSADPEVLYRIRSTAINELDSGYAAGVGGRASSIRTYSPQEVAGSFQRVRKYSQLLHDRTRELVPGNISASIPIRLDEGYVSPHFTAEQPERFMKFRQAAQASEAIPLEQIQRRLHRLVVLGTPGAGKSTLAQYLTWTTSSDAIDPLETVPFLITLREFELERTSKDLKVTEYLALWSKREMQLDLTSRDVELILMTGRGFIIFDGLDELLVSERRRSMAALIGSFASMYPDASILVTCRAVGYLESRLPEDVFPTVYLDEFSEAQVSAYVTAWFKRATRLSAQDRKSLPALFMQQSKSAEDLRRNPLMLGLMCRVFQEWRDIPQNRTELYEECGGLLFREWDLKRGIKPSKEVLRQDARLALQEIAHWRLTDSGVAKGIPKTLLIQKLSDIFLRDRFEDRGASRAEATDLVELWSGRAWVLSDVGNPDGEELYDFTHLTFAEYFAAAHLSRLAGTPNRLWRKIAARIRRGEWDVVAALAIQIKDRDHADCCNQVYELALNSSKELRADRRANVLAFLSAHVASLLPSPRLRRALVDEALDLALLSVSTSSNSLVQPWKKIGTSSEIANLVESARWRESEPGNNEQSTLAVEWDELVVDAARLREPLRTLWSARSLPDIQSEFSNRVELLVSGTSRNSAAAWLLAEWMNHEFGTPMPPVDAPIQLARVDWMVSFRLAQNGSIGLADLLEMGRLALIFRPSQCFETSSSAPTDHRCLADDLGWRLADGSFNQLDSQFLSALGSRDPSRLVIPQEWAENSLMRRGCERYLQPSSSKRLTRSNPPKSSDFFVGANRANALSEIDPYWCLGAFRVLAALEEIALYSTADEVVSPSIGFMSPLTPLVFGRRVEGISMFDDPDDTSTLGFEGIDDSEVEVADESEGLDRFGRWLGQSIFGEMYRWALGEFNYVRVITGR